MNPFDELFNIFTELKCTAIKNADLSSYTTFKIGGPAPLLVKPDSAKKAGIALHLINQANLPVLVLGNGSNVLVSDEGFNGVVISTTGLERCNIDENGIIDCDAGLRLFTLCRFALEHELSGLEFAYGIPGSVGGAVYMNAGAYGGEMKDILLECRHINSCATEGLYTKNKLDFGYRRSYYTGKNYLITGMQIKLEPGSKREIENKMTEIMNKRRDNQPLDLPSAGSVFKRPKNSYAGMLIEECGLKGYTIGGAMVSTKHAGFIVNNGSATANDVKELIQFIKNKVYTQKSVILETEIIFV